MAFFNFIETVADSVNNFSDKVRKVSNFASNVRRTLDDLSDPLALAKSIRTRSLPNGAQPAAKTVSTGSFISASNYDGEDWRVRIHLPAQPATFENASILKPLQDSNASMIFPTTPQILVTHSANYNMFHPIHTNYPYPVYENSQVEDITISGEFPVENEADGRYWIAAVHFCRSITKMFYGQGDLRGHPPPRCALSGYGNFIFDRMPIVVKMFSIDLPNNVDYIKVPIDGLDLQSSTPTSQIQSGSYTYVPTLSTINLTVAPAFSRDATRQFDLNTFINGGYVGQKTPGGFI